MTGVSETYVSDPDDHDGHTFGVPGIGRVTPVSRIDDADERTVIERTDAEQSAFAAKMAEWRRTGGIPGYNGPRAAR